MTKDAPADSTEDSSGDSEFSVSRTLANSLTGSVYRYTRWLTGKVLDVYPALRESPCASLSANGKWIYTVRGFPLLDEVEVGKLASACKTADASVDEVVEAWKAIEKDPASTRFGDLIDMSRFDEYLRDVILPTLEKQVADWFCDDCLSLAHHAPRRLSVYHRLNGDLQVMILYLAYRLEPKWHDGLRRILTTLDWDFLRRSIEMPFQVQNDDGKVLATSVRVNELLSVRARLFVLATCAKQSTVGHRVLADEYERICGIPQAELLSDSIQERMLLHSDPLGDGDGLSALCLSGGGIRSAAFCLGAIQALASRRLFGKFHYLSTVSGGGYVGTGLMRWMAAKVIDDKMDVDVALSFAEQELDRLRGTDYVQRRMTGTVFDQEGPLTWLRMNSTYLARQLSVFSADAWTIVATYLRNLIVTWVIFWPWIGLFLLLPWVAVLVSKLHGVAIINAWSLDLGVFKIGAPSVAGLVGAIVGVVGATYFYQGQPNALAPVYANGLRQPKGGDNRAAFGAGCLVMGCILLSYMMWADVDDGLQGDYFRGRAIWSVWHYVPVVIAVIGTQLCLAWKNVDQNIVGLSTWVMTFAALVATAIQLGLIFCVRWGLGHWGPDESAYQPLALATLIRGLVTPSILLMSLLLGEGLKAALRSFTERPDRREHQARAHAFSFMLATAWLAVALLVVGVPALLSYYGESVPGLTAAGSSVSVALSAWFGYRKSSPGKPEAQTPVSLTLVGLTGVILLAVLLSIATWKVFEHEATYTSVSSDPISLPRPFEPKKLEVDYTAPARCQCAHLAQQQEDPNTPLEVQKLGFWFPKDQSVCTIPAAQCVSREFPSFFNDLIHQFDARRLGIALVVLLGSVVACYLLGLVIRMNEFSLHGFYRDRLIRAFYGGFRGSSAPRKPALFTGFDPQDDLPFCEIGRLYKSSGKLSSTGAALQPPFLVVNTALNLVKGTELAWQERKADSFTMSALSAGNYRLGHRPIARFANSVKLGTAMAISGAAFNPNMGYNTSTPMAFLMSVLNVRLGWWLGNPKLNNWHKQDPTSSSNTLLLEATGQTTDTSDWIHLSDGGHFDNLGLWEMVHRRCRHILVIDASQDVRFAFEDLNSAIRRIRIDMGIEISADNDPILLFPRSARAAGLSHARFTIHYPALDGGEPISGTLLYLKPCIYGSEPPDVQEYAEKHPEFPHETTADQFFNESQFESYRKLGEWEMEQLLRYATKQTAPGKNSALRLVAQDNRPGLFQARQRKI